MSGPPPLETAEDVVRGASRSLGRLLDSDPDAGDTGATKPLASLSLAEWQHAIEVNLTASFLCAREALPDMVRRGDDPLVE